MEFSNFYLHGGVVALVDGSVGYYHGVAVERVAHRLFSCMLSAYVHGYYGDVSMDYRVPIVVFRTSRGCYSVLIQSVAVVVELVRSFHVVECHRSVRYVNYSGHRVCLLSHASLVWLANWRLPLVYERGLHVISSAEVFVHRSFYFLHGDQGYGA